MHFSSPSNFQVGTILRNKLEIRLYTVEFKDMLGNDVESGVDDRSYFLIEYQVTL